LTSGYRTCDEATPNSLVGPSFGHTSDHLERYL
jgi:hypothetical protein